MPEPPTEGGVAYTDLMPDAEAVEVRRRARSCSTATTSSGGYCTAWCASVRLRVPACRAVPAPDRGREPADRPPCWLPFRRVGGRHLSREGEARGAGEAPAGRGDRLLGATVTATCRSARCPTASRRWWRRARPGARAARPAARRTVHRADPRGAREPRPASRKPVARMSRSLAAARSSASSHEIGTKPGSWSRPLSGLVRRIGCGMRLGSSVFCTRPQALTHTRPPPGC